MCIMKQLFYSALFLLTFLMVSCDLLKELDIPHTNGHKYVDLGLPSGTLWATMNVGATSVEDSGDYFAWGETSPKEEYSWSSYQWCKGYDNTITKYCTNAESGTVDNKTTLELTDDAARKNWGGDWRMPTATEVSELLTYCTKEIVEKKGVKGYKLTGLNRNTIFFPFSGFIEGTELVNGDKSGYVWSSSLETAESNKYAYELDYDDGTIMIFYSSRIYGQTVRPVLSK